MSRKFQKWVDSYHNDVWSLARYLLQDASEAEDVAQEAYIKLWKHRENMNVQQVRPWLLTVTRNACLDRLRRKQPAPEVETVDAPGPAADALRDELRLRLNLAIEELKEPYRSLVVLRDMQQHSYDEVARITELTLSQVKVYLHRARRQLRERLAEVRA